VIIAALLGAAISARQILLHILPGDAGFGSAFLGLHFYSWAFLFFVSAMLAAGVMLTFNKQFAPEAKAPTISTTCGPGDMACHRPHRAQRSQCAARMRFFRLSGEPRPL
jgi:hypothetical protein